MPHDDLQKLLTLAPIRMGILNQAAAETLQSENSSVSKHFSFDIEITEEYQLVLRLLQKRFPIVFVSGKAGTGKSTLISWLRNMLPCNIAVVAPTGVAALNVNGATIHSFFCFPPHLIRPEDIKPVFNRRVYKALDLLIVDEVSMVRADLIDGMDLFLRKNGRHSDLPFGGAQLLLVGDLFQLPPVIEKKEDEILASMDYATPYFFSAHALQECPVAPVELSRVWRQVNPVFAEMLNAVREARNLDVILPLFNARVEAFLQAKTNSNHVEHVSEGIVTLTATNTVADTINLAQLRKLPGKVVVFRGVLNGKFSVEESRMPSPLELQLKPGAQVMFTKNDEQRRWVNGSLGVVRDLSEPNVVRVEMLTDHPGEIHDVSRVQWNSYRYVLNPENNQIEPAISGTYTQFPLMLAWAITIHKSQGKTLDRVRIDLGHGAFAPGQVYVALSRCRQLEHLQLVRPIKPSDVRCDARIVRFYKDCLTIQQRFADGDTAHEVTLPGTNAFCPHCGAALRQIDGAAGGQVRCTRFPDCDYIIPL